MDGLVEAAIGAVAIMLAAFVVYSLLVYLFA